MVSQKSITDIIDKCWTKARIREKLSNYTQEEKNQLLEDKMNPFEKQQYKYRLIFRDNVKESLKKYEEEGMTSSELYEDEKKDLERYEEIIFQYERRIIEGYDLNPIREVPSFDINNFHDDYDDTKMGVGITPNEMEAKLVENQRKVEFSDREQASLYYWFSDGHGDINDSIFQNNYWKNLSNEEKKEKNKSLNRHKQNLTHAINKTEGLTEPTVLYYGSPRFDVTSRVGDRINFKGYTSMSFNKDVAREFGIYTYKCLTPQGVKGICGNTDQFDSPHRIEHEYLTGRDTNGTIVGIDYENREILVLVDEPLGK